MTGRAGAPVEVELLRVHLPLLEPLRAAHGTEEVRDLVLVRVLTEQGSEGWGECSALARPTYTAEYTAGAWALLRDELAPAALAGRADDLVGHPMAKAALSTALLDASLRSRGTALVDHLAAEHGRPAEALPCTAVVGRRAGVDGVLRAVEGRIAEGVAMVKLKVTGRREDLDAVAAVRGAWPDLPLAVDGNGTLDARAVSILDGHRLAYVEQPLPPDALVDSAALARRVATPIALDESITSEGVLLAALALGAGRVVNVKPARLGGVREAAAVARTASEAGGAAFVGGMYESGVGRAAALAVAALPACALPTDLGPAGRHLARDVTDPGVVDGHGRVVVPTGPGIGVTPSPDRLDRVTVERTVLRR